MMKVLVTNDDGIMAEGLASLALWAQDQGHQVMVVAPTRNASGQSGAISLSKPLTVMEVKNGHWAVGGTPADCVRIALGFLGFHPDLVLSGINHGANLGLDVHASGTVGAARMAAIRGIPAVAVSAQGHDWDFNARLWRHHGPLVVENALSHGPGVVASVNLPDHGGDNLVTAELSGPRFDDQMQWAEFDGTHHIVRLDFVERSSDSLDLDTDADAVARGYSTVTYLPLVPYVSIEARSTRSPA
jgi:5'-nucleotidase